MPLFLELLGQQAAALLTTVAFVNNTGILFYLTGAPAISLNEMLLAEPIGDFAKPNTGAHRAVIRVFGETKFVSTIAAPQTGEPVRCRPSDAGAAAMVLPLPGAASVEFGNVPSRWLYPVTPQRCRVAVMPEHRTDAGLSKPQPPFAKAVHGGVANKGKNRSVIGLDRLVSTAAADPISIELVSDEERTRDARAPDLPGETAAIRRAEDWQECLYCLAPSQAEHKIYFSTPVPVRAIAGDPRAVFKQMLTKVELAHDNGVQCPRAPNRPTLVFRQRQAIRWNEELGNTVITVTWQPLN